MCFMISLQFLLLVYVKSDTVVGDSTHQTGVVLAEIVKANIPVKNGVVHLISRPLMVVDNTVHQFLKVRAVQFINIKLCLLPLLKKVSFSVNGHK